MTSGGTESIVMAVKAARDHARRHRGQSRLRGNLVLPLSAHPAFDKAAALMDIEVRRIGLTGALVADVAAMDAAADGETLMLVGSVPCFPYGTIDPIPALADLAQRRGIWLHVDACVGGWLAPFAADLGRPIPRFDFALPGVCSLSADLHKFGFCPKPASTIFYASAELAAFQRLEFDAWPSGRFGTDTLVGTRPGGAVAGAWAVLRYLGRAGYRRIATDLLAIRDAYVEGMLAIEGMHMRGEPPLMNLAFGCDDVDMAQVATLLAARGWVPGQLRTPPSLHLMLSLHHGPARAAYVADVAACVAELRGGQNTARSEAYYA
jgi:glutamate/tyrosine decarboxylase-like PLP-dependent enzyme